MNWRRFGWRGVAYLLVVIIAAILVAHWWRVLLPIWRQQGMTLAGATVLMIIALIVQARNFISFLDDGRAGDTWTLSRVWALTALLNYLGPLQPGVAARVAYLAKRGVRIGDSLLATWRQICVSIWISTGGLALGLWLTGDVRGRVPALVLGVAFVGAAPLRNGIKAVLDLIERPHWFVRHKQLLHSAIGGITLLSVLGVLAQYVIGTLLLLWVYRGFGAAISLGQAIVLACMVYASSLVAIMPGNLGVMDGIYMLGGHGMGLSVPESAALALLLRGAHITGCGLMVLIGGIFPPRRRTDIKPQDE
jgi:hypothetical protein